ncbi:MAG: hypothetical protein IKO47_06200 [Ruminococcus sp.]|nr:hypothetical protein [Ruminococcus sp.]
MKFRKILAEIMAALTIGVFCVACGNIDYESSSSKSPANTGASSPDVEDENASTEEPSAEQISAETTEECKTEEDLTTEGTTESEELTTAENEETTTTNVTTAITTTENYIIRVFQEFSPEDEGYYLADIDGSQLPSAVSDDAGYVSDYKSKHFIWLDVKKEIDYVFNGKFIKISLKVKDSTPSGNYPVHVVPDVSTVMGKCLNREINVSDGEIAVGKNSTDSNGIANDNAPSIYADKISAQPGETVDYYVYFDNNPGIAAFLLKISYDSNAFDWISTETCGEFADIPSANTMNNSN